MYKISISLELSEQFLRDVLCTAVWYGSSYWAGYENAKFYEGKHYQEIQSVTVNDLLDEDESESKYEIVLDDIAKGIERLIGRDFNIEESHGIPAVSYSAAMLKAAAQNESGEVDAELADIVLQLACFGHMIYG